MRSFLPPGLYIRVDGTQQQVPNLQQGKFEAHQYGVSQKKVYGMNAVYKPHNLDIMLPDYLHLQSLLNL